MSDKPILFSGPMVAAILDGRKTQTRRVLKPQPTLPWCSLFSENGKWWTGDGITGDVTEHLRVPIAIGDRLWCRETWTETQHGKAVYRADACDQTGQRWSSIVPGDPDSEVRWRPSIFMPRRYSRLTLIVTGVKVERLQEISEEDAIAEGIARNPVQEGTWIDYPEGTSAAGWRDPRESFRSLWESINGSSSWAENLLVAAYTFTVHRANIDALGKEAT